MLQDAFRRMGLTQTPEDVAFVSSILDTLPPDHPVQRYRVRAPDLAYDAGIVDSFLHPQDRAYSVPQVLEWVEGAGLGFQSWMENSFYEPHAHLSPAVRARLESLPDAERWAAVEGLLGASMRHSFILRHPDRVHRITFEGDDFLDYRPRGYPDAVLGQRDEQLLILRGHAAFEVNQAEATTFAWSDGSRTIRSMEEDPVFAEFDREALRDFFRGHFQRMWRVGVMMFQR
jgi:hypothetical protein